MHWRIIPIRTIAAIGLAVRFPLPLIAATADDSAAEEINALQDEIAAREARLESVQAKLKSSLAAINEASAKADSLASELGILENAQKALELDVEATTLQIEQQHSELHIITLEIETQERSIKEQKKLLASLLRQMEHEDTVEPLELFFGSKTFFELFDTLNRLQEVQDELGAVLSETEARKAQLQSRRDEEAERLAQLVVLDTTLKERQKTVEQQFSAKDVLLSQTQASESQYQSLARRLREEQSSIDAQVRSLQEKIDERLSDADTSGEASVLSWPVENFIMTTRFHDPTYPFRNLFEHSGLDLAIPQGSPVTAAAPGYVAFARTGSMYGNYVMIIHGKGVATLYAHLSSIGVKVDQYVGRGDVIARSGGAPGVAGSGFSTGPHLHFEVRSNGIPVDPMGYLFGR